MSELKYLKPRSTATYETPKTLYRIVFLPSRKGKGEIVWMIHEDVNYKLVDQGVTSSFKEAEACVLAVLEAGVKPKKTATKIKTKKQKRGV